MKSILIVLFYSWWHIFIESFASDASHFQNHCAIPNCVCVPVSLCSIVRTIGMVVPLYECLYLWLCILWQLYSDYNHCNDYDDNYDLCFSLYPCKMLGMYLYVPQYFFMESMVLYLSIPPTRASTSILLLVPRCALPEEAPPRGWHARPATSEEISQVCLARKWRNCRGCECHQFCSSYEWRSSCCREESTCLWRWAVWSVFFTKAGME